MRRLIVPSVSVSLSLLLAAPAIAQVPPDDGPDGPPSPRAFVSQLDLECHPADGAPVTPVLGVRQLNPVLKDKIPPQQAFVYELEQVCVPVAKNGQIPGPEALAFIRWIDVACYRASAPPVNFDLQLSHLNPVLADLPDEHVTMTSLAQVCVPVSKNGRPLPAPAHRLASYFDLGCYDLDGQTHDANRSLVLDHLNPVIHDMGLPDHVVTIHRPRRLCVPIGKNNQPIPDGVRDIVEWADFLEYRATPVTPVPVLPLVLRHLNPLFAAFPPFQVWLQPTPVRLMVPVAKNGKLPPTE